MSHWHGLLWGLIFPGAGRPCYLVSRRKNLLSRQAEVRAMALGVLAWKQYLPILLCVRQLPGLGGAWRSATADVGRCARVCCKVALTQNPAVTCC